MYQYNIMINIRIDKIENSYNILFLLMNGAILTRIDIYYKTEKNKRKEDVRKSSPILQLFLFFSIEKGFSRFQVIAARVKNLFSTPNKEYAIFS